MRKENKSPVSANPLFYVDILESVGLMCRMEIMSA